MINTQVFVEALRIVTVYDLESDECLFAYGAKAVKSRMTTKQLWRYYRIELKLQWQKRSSFRLKPKLKKLTLS
jgi:hypothetical protein